MLALVIDRIRAMKIKKAVSTLIFGENTLNVEKKSMIFTKSVTLSRTMLLFWCPLFHDKHETLTPKLYFQIIFAWRLFAHIESS